MKKVLPSLLFILNAGISIAQPGEWVWIKGSNMVNDPGVFGVQGVSNPANNPPSLYEPCEWTDLNGNFWLFGGMDQNREYGDLWKYNPSINEWTWMKGTGLWTVAANYGTIGVPAATNDPGSRSWASATWVDNAGNFWLFGGRQSTIGIFNDLWRYQPATNNWTWMKGPQGTGNAGVYGTQGVSSPVNVPPSRCETSVSWTDNAGNLWLFGGNSNTGCLNDLWRYNISSNEWTWMKGSQFSGAPDVYGVIGVEDPANTPGGRQVYSHWKDLNGNFWIQGGTCGSQNNYNDLWRYNPITNNWTWYKGGSTVGVYGTRCIPDPANTPGFRFENRACVTDANGNFWLFGGFNNYSFLDVFNDLWFYCVTSNTWTWVSGDNFYNSIGNWGTLGVSSPLNVHNARAGSVMWSDQLGHLYIFGGTNNSWPDNYSDLWMYTIDTTCTYCSLQPLALFNAPNLLCPGTCTDFLNTSLGSTSFQWNFPGGNPSTSTLMNPSNICYSTPGTYDVTLIAYNGAGSDTLTYFNYITVFPSPPPQGILQSGDTLFSNAGAVSYQWYENGNLIPGATGYYYVAIESGNYNVVATDVNGCEVEAAIFDVIASTSPLTLGDGSGLRLFPNPVLDKLEIRNLISGTNLQITIYNTVGEKVYIQKYENVRSDLTIDVAAMPAGFYIFEITDGRHLPEKPSQKNNFNNHNLYTMKKILTSLLLFCFCSAVHAQIICIYCYDQNDSISQNVNNFVLNGGFENTNCIFNSNSNTFCPNSVNYNCDIVDWVCTGGGSSTYSIFADSNIWYVQSGTHSPYFGNAFAPPCITGDTSCLVSNDCETTGISPGYPLNSAAFGGSLGVSLEQLVSGLTPGATYVLEFWSGGEGSFQLPGMFGVDIGFGYTYLRTNPTPAHVGIGKRYIIIFNATATSHLIKFTNWGHICNDCTELILDDVRLYTLAELSPIVPPCTGANVVALFSAPNHICPGTCTDFTNLSVNATSFLWSFPGGNPSVSTDVSPAGICYNTPGSYPVTLISSGGISSDTLTLNNYITVYPTPPPQGIMQIGDTLFANQGAVSYQWYSNGNLIPGATEYFYVAPESGNYNVVATDANGCEVEAVIFDVIASTSVLSKGDGVTAFPNPVLHNLEIGNLSAGSNLTIVIYNNLGEIVFESKEKNVSKELSIDLSAIPAGIYHLKITGEKSSVVKIFTKQ